MATRRAFGSSPGNCFEFHLFAHLLFLHHLEGAKIMSATLNACSTTKSSSVCCMLLTCSGCCPSCLRTLFCCFCCFVHCFCSHTLYYQSRSSSCPRWHQQHHHITRFVVVCRHPCEHKFSPNRHPWERHDSWRKELSHCLLPSAARRQPDCTVISNAIFARRQDIATFTYIVHIDSYICKSLLGVFHVRWEDWGMGTAICELAQFASMQYIMQCSSKLCDCCCSRFDYFHNVVCLRALIKKKFKWFVPRTISTLQERMYSTTGKQHVNKQMDKNCCQIACWRWRFHCICSGNDNQRQCSGYNFLPILPQNGSEKKGQSKNPWQELLNAQSCLDEWFGEYRISTKTPASSTAQARRCTKKT